MPAAVEAWNTWFGAWFASFWKPEDLPGIRQIIRLYDQVERGEFQRATELRLSMDTYGITPKGQQDRRWQAAKIEAPAVRKSAARERYAHLSVIDDDAVAGA